MPCAQRREAESPVRPACGAQPRAVVAALAQTARPGGVSSGPLSVLAGGGLGRWRRAPAPVDRSARRDRTVRYYRRRARLHGRAGNLAAPARLRDRAGAGRREETDLSGAPSGRAPGLLRRRSGGPGAALAGRAAAGHGHGGGRDRFVRPRQPRRQADAQAARPRRQGGAWPGRDPGAAGGREPGVQGPGRGLRRRTGEPRRGGRRPAGGRPRGHEGGDAGPGLGRGAGLRAVRRDHRRDRRVRPAGTLRLGSRVPRQVPGGLWPHPGAGGRVAEPDDLHRHRLCFRRQADGAALSGAGAGLGAGRQAVFRAGQAAGPGGSVAVRPAGARRAARYRGRTGQAAHQHRPAPNDHHPSGQRHGGPGGDEPVRHRPALANLPAAHHVADQDLARAGPAGTSGRGLCLLSGRRRRPGGLRNEAYGIPGRGDRLSRRDKRPRPLRRNRRRGRRGLHPHRAPVLQPAGIRDRPARPLAEGAV